MSWIHIELHGTILQPERTVKEEDVNLINSLGNKPPSCVDKKDVYVRRCRLASDAIDSGFGRFRTDDLRKLLVLTQGVPASVVFRNEIPIARYFGGDLYKNRGTGITCIVPKFYWMKLHSEAENFRANIDGGIYPELSVGLIYHLPTCSICAKDIRYCEHLPGKEYESKT